MADYIKAPLDVEPEEFFQLFADYLKSVIPGWDDNDPALDVWIGEAVSQIAASVAETGSDVPDLIFRYAGEKLHGLAAQEATFATGTTAWTLIDTDGHTIPEGTTLLVDTPDGLVGFQTEVEWVVPAGANTATGVPVTAVEAGAAADGLSGTAQLQDFLDYVDTVTFEAPTSGGADAEPDDDYLDRLSDELQLLTPRPVTADDYATLARRVNGVERAVALDNFVPPATEGVEGAVTVAVVDEDGQDPGAGVRTDVETLLETERILNVDVHVIAPTYTAVDVTFTATAFPGFVPADVQAAAEAAVAEYLSPANWGRPAFGEDVKGWENEDKVRVGELYYVLNGVEGLHHVTALTINGGAADVTLSGAVPMPTPGTIAGTVS